METTDTTLIVDPLRPTPAQIQRIARVLESGKIVVVPTETMYGLLTRADRQDALEELYRVKQRPLTQATALLVGGAEDVVELGQMNESAERILARFLPGPLTLVLRAKPDWPPPRVVDRKIGIRWSSSKIIGALMRQISFPVSATSANVSGQKDAESVEEIRAALGDKVALYVDAGRLVGPVSTVVDCSSTNVRVLREGAISREKLQECLGSLLE